MTKIEVQYINKVLVKETFALVFISIDFKAFLQELRMVELLFMYFKCFRICNSLGEWHDF